MVITSTAPATWPRPSRWSDPPRGDLDVGGVAGIGVDAVDVVRFRRVVARRPGIVHRLFTDTERGLRRRSRDPGPRLAVRFAAKEAVLKALGVGVGAAGFRDVEVTRADDGEPGLVLSGRAEALSVGRGVHALARVADPHRYRRRRHRGRRGPRAAA